MFWHFPDKFNDFPALYSENAEITYADLSVSANAWVEETAANLPKHVTRPLVLMRSCNSISAVAAYIGALRAGWPVILGSEAECAQGSRVRHCFRPNVVLTDSGTGDDADNPNALTCEVTSAPQHVMHEDLAVLLSTSGTTGAAKMVRLSRQNISANAASIADYLDAKSGDVAITTLPWHYSYGMSVLNVALATGGSLVLNDAAITEPAFWETARRHRVTSLSCVPVQFDMLAKGDPLSSRLPSLRYLTQAGGRLDPKLGRRFHREARRDGWLFYIMYGQTEAAPRISYVPVTADEDALETIGRPVPGGKISLIDENGAAVEGVECQGELLYEGPNVMMGYATCPAELALPAGDPILRTGDIAVRQRNGYFRIVGRAARFLKLNGLRLSLDELEARFRRLGLVGYCTGSDAQLVVFAHEGDEIAFADELTGLGLLPTNFIISRLDHVPLNANAKVDYKQLNRRAEELLAAQPAQTSNDLEILLERVLVASPIDTNRSFLDYGGNSLSYLEIQLYFQRENRELPEGWETRPLSDLFRHSAADQCRDKRYIPVSGDVLWRIAAITAVILHHTTPWKVSGGAYLMLVLAGFSLARFQSGNLFAGRGIKVFTSMLVPLLTGYYVILSLVHLSGKPVDTEWFLLLGNFDQDINPHGIEPYWFVCAYAQIVALACLPFMIPKLAAQIHRHQFLSGMAGLAIAFGIVEFLSLTDIIPGLRIRHTLGGLELFMIGWCVYFAKSERERAVLLIALIAIFVRHWNGISLSAAIFIYLGVSTILIRSHIRVPVAIANGALALASVSMFTYLVHPVVQSLVHHMGLPAPILATAVTLISFAVAFGIKMAIDRLSSIQFSQRAPRNSDLLR